MRMYVVAPILRQPKQSEMALSTQVKDCVQLATTALRDALAFAARVEHPLTVNSLADLLVRLESLESMDEIMEKFGRPRDTPKL